MSDFTNDPRLTDYVLGELDEAQRAEVERLLEESPSARAVVDELRELSGLLTESLKSQPAPALADDQRAVIVAAAATLPPQPRRPQRSLRGVAVVLATLTASVAAVVAIVANLQRHDENTGVAQTNNRISGKEVATLPSLLGTTVAQNDRERTMEKLDEDELQFSLATERYGKEPLVSAPQGAPKDVSSSDFSDIEVISDKLSETNGDGLSTTGQPAETNGPVAPTVTKQMQSVLERSPMNFPTAGTSVGGEVVSNNGTTPLAYKVRVQEMSAPSATVTTHQPVQEIQVTGDAAHTQRSVVLNQIRVAPGDLGKAKEDATVEYTRSLSENFVDREEGRITWYAFGERQSGVEAKKLDQKESKPRSGPNTEAYDAIVENPFLLPTGAPLSTFSIDVDTASYSNTRRFLSAAQKPPRDSVRVEELVNYFRYEDAPPTDGKPFAVHLEVGACPWAADHRVVRVALKGKEISRSQRPATNLVFLLDVSGSMRDDNKLPLVKQAMKLLVNEMTENDRIAIVTYAGNAGLVLDSTSGDKKDIILKAIENLNADGSTNGEAGIKLAYSTAVGHLYKEGSNRVILCTDGDFNVGVSDDDELVNLIQQKARDSQVFLSIFGFGMGNLKDGKLEKLADKGNGHYGYVDNLREAKKLFVEDLTGTLYTIAKDVKLQVEFNPAKVGAYRLIGYENRVMPAQDFNDDTKDAGEIGAGHSVVALYEIVTTDKMPQLVNRPELKYQAVTAPAPAEEPKTQLKPSDELLTVWLRYKQPDGTTSDKLEFPLADKPGPSTQGSRDFQWTTAVAAFGMLLRESQFRGQSNFDMVLELAQANRAGDEDGHRAEFIELVKTAKSLYTPAPPASPATVQPANPR